MRSVLIGSLRTHTRRYVAAALAVAIGVAFVVVTAALSSATKSGMVAGLDLPYQHADTVVDRPDTPTAIRLVDKYDAWPVGWTVRQVRAGDRVLSTRMDVGPVSTDREWQWQQLTAGRFPTRPGETLVDTATAASKHVRVGDHLEIGSGADRVDAEVVGLADSGTPLARADVYVPWADFVTFRDEMYLTSVAVAGPGAADVPHAESVDSYLTSVRKDLNRQVDVVAIVLLLFAAVALFVSVLVIANTFSILLAHRLRDFALLRCVGATRRQVAQLVRREALALGAVASLVGLVAGVGLGHLLVALIRHLSDSAPLGSPEVGPGWLIAGFLVGVLVTAVASWLPTRRVLAVSPLEALRPQEDIDMRSPAGRLRLAVAGVLLAGGVALLGLAVATQENLVMVGGGAATFVGVLLFGPVLVPALVRAAGAALAAVAGPSARLASANATRNPRRTAVTAASLLVGVTLTTAVLTSLASARDIVTSETNDDHPVDVALVSSRTPLSERILARATGVRGVDRASLVQGALATIDGRRGPIPLLVPGAQDVVRSPVRVAPGTVVLPGVVADDLPDRVRVTVGDRAVRLRVVPRAGFGTAGLVAASTLHRLHAHPAAYALWVRASNDADPEDLAGDLGALADVEVENGLADRAWVDLQLNVLTGAVVGLLGISVVIALVGIANTLGLSVLERTREHALLRALGLTRRQLRRMLAAEGVLLSVTATALGTAIGVAFAWVAVQTVVEPVAHGAAIVLPLGQLAAVVLVAAGAGLLSCLLPARRAARVAPAAGLSLE